MFMTIPNEWSTYIREVEEAIKPALTCPYQCNLYQWATGGVTQNLPEKYFPKIRNISMAEIAPDYYKGRIPEFYYWTSNKIGVATSLTEENAMSILLNHGVGSLGNTYEFYRMVGAVLNNNQDYLEKRFSSTGFNKIAGLIVSYCKYMFNSLYPFTVSLTAEDLIWGYTDAYVQNMVKILTQTNYKF